MTVDEASIAEVEDDTVRHILSDHEQRLYMIERVGLLVGGYMIAEGQEFVQAISGVI